MFRSTVITIFIHVLCLVLFISLPVVFMSGQPGNAGVVSQILFPEYWLFYLVFIILFYGNTYLLIPRLLFRKQYLYYFAIILLLFCLVFALKPFDKLMSASNPRPPLHNGLPRNVGPERQMGEVRPFPPPDGMPGFPRRGGHLKAPQSRNTDIVSIILFVMVMSIGIAIRFIQQWRITEQRAVQAEAGKANAELSFLKAQINPHFLFNTLNNIYLMAVTRNEHTADSVMKLSNIMRYVTEDIHDDFVPLQHEVDFIKDYIDLQRLRLNKNTTVNFTVTGHLEFRRIAPLILMTFVENVFKYGVSSHEPGTITIALAAEKEAIRFMCSNKQYTPQREVQSTGIGISNTKQRLELLYPSRHTLEITAENGYFTVHLNLFG